MLLQRLRHRVYAGQRPPSGRRHLVVASTQRLWSADVERRRRAARCPFQQAIEQRRGCGSRSSPLALKFKISVTRYADGRVKIDVNKVCAIDERTKKPNKIGANLDHTLKHAR